MTTRHIGVSGVLVCSAMMGACADDGGGGTETSPTAATTEPGDPSGETPGTTMNPSGQPTMDETTSVPTTSEATSETASEAATSETATSEATTETSSSGTTAGVETETTDSSTTMAGACAPQAMEACYSGPPETQDQGTCKAGTRTCGEDGQWGPCTGEVLPQAESCGDGEDVDCDGELTPCTGAGLWAKNFGETSNQRGWAIASDGDGNVAVAGAMFGTIDFGGGPLSATDKTNVFLAKLDPAGEHLWSQVFEFSATNGSDLYVSDVAYDAAGSLFMTGFFNGSVDFGGIGVSAGFGPSDVYLAKFDASGAVQWAKAWGEDEGDAVHSLATTPEGGVVLCGTFRDEIFFGPIHLVAAGLDDIFVASIDAEGTPLWAKRFGDAQYQWCRGIGVDVDGDVAIAAEVHGTVDFGGPALVSAGQSDLALARFDAAGQHIWSALHGNAQSQLVRTLAVDTSGGVVVAGETSQPTDFGGGLVDSGNNADMFVARYDEDGGLEWVNLYARTNTQVIQNVAIDGADHVVATGYFTGTIAFGGLDLVSPSPDFDAFTVKLGPDGSHVYSLLQPDADEKTLGQYGYGVAIDPQDNILLTGGFYGSIEIAGKDLLSNEGDSTTDVFVAKLKP
ncbi:hypothetical protein [Nannocystis radixulma]|uniref:Uncharacterized protein n=1 Tax=Nannocystis radixulma TaxID=2995305 RepID=A0ABT5BHK4_9BACT|nr:hypothetical protein [Nannocystis radixulma]MDC0672517.1 hypothetical protein [Nannocystis radixulma]